MMARASLDLWHTVQQFLFREARLLDERRFDEWLELLEADLFYFMPILQNRYRHEAAGESTRYGDLAIFEDDKESLVNRVKRLATGQAWAEAPPSRTRHYVANVEVEPTERADEVLARSAILVYRSHLERDEEWFAGRREDLLRKRADDWRIAKRTIVLDQTVLQAKGLSIFF